MKIEVTETVTLSYDEVRRIIHKALELPTHDKIDGIVALPSCTGGTDPWLQVKVVRPSDTRNLPR